jgi:hypothetical protein
MGMLAGLAIGWMAGSRAGRGHVDEIVKSLKALTATEEFADVVWAVRAQLGHTLRDLADVVEGARPAKAPVGVDLVDQVRGLFGT